MSTGGKFVGGLVGNALDPLHIVYKPGAPDDPNRQAALDNAASAEMSANETAQEKLARIYGSDLPALQRGTGLAADQARMRQGQVVGAANDMAGWKPGTFDAAVSPYDVYAIQSGQAAATQARTAQAGAQQADLAPILAAQRGTGPSVAASQQAVAMDAAQRNAGMMAAAGRGGNGALAVRGAMLQSAAPGVAVAGAQARGQELASMRGLADQGVANGFGNALGTDQTAQALEQQRNRVEIANRQALVRQSGLASDAFGQATRDYKMGGALTRTADTAKLNAYDQTMGDTENAFSSYQDYLHSLYGTGLNTAVTAGQRASGNLETILGAQRQQDAANMGLVSSVIGTVGSLGKGGQKDPNSAG